jgi:hypothetical protein
MKRLISLAVAAVLAATFGGTTIGGAQKKASSGGLKLGKPAGPAPEANYDCDHPFGSGNFQWCLSDNGNLTRFEVPSGSDHSLGAYGPNEGYAICASTGDYFSLGYGVEAGLGVAVNTVTSKGMTSARTTTDGVFTLTTKWSGDKTEKDVTAAMTLENNSAAPVTGVRLVRYIQAGVDGDSGDDDYMVASGGLFARDVQGFVMQPIGSGITTWEGDMYLYGCVPVVNPPTGTATHILFISYFDMGTIGPLKKKSAKVAYRVD